MLAGFRHLKRRARAGTQNQKRFFQRFWDLLQGAQEGSRCSASSVFTLAASGEGCRLSAPFWTDLGSPKLNYTHFGVSLSRFLVAKWGVVLKVTFCGFPGAGRILSLRRRPVGGKPGALGPLILNPTDCHRRQDTGYEIQDTGYSVQHTHTSIQE